MPDAVGPMMRGIVGENNGGCDRTGCMSDVDALCSLITVT